MGFAQFKGMLFIGSGHQGAVKLAVCNDPTCILFDLDIPVVKSFLVNDSGCVQKLKSSQCNLQENQIKKNNQ